MAADRTGHVGFTGTRHGMTRAQRTALVEVLQRLQPRVIAFHHGDCVGADAEAHAVVRLHFPEVVLHVHPPLDPTRRAWCVGHRLHARLPYRERNQAIVDATDVLIAAPQAPQEQLRSGTWMTIRYARKVGRQVVIL